MTTYAVTVLEGPDRGRRFELDGRLSRALIGQGPACELKLTDTEVVKTAETIPLTQARHFGRTLGGSFEMRRLYPLCERLASANVPVIIEGETGTGKEVLAESLHEEGPRRSGPFMVFDCTTVAPNLVESELFGHERGAFTGAVGTRKGVFEQAHGGTLFIDEIGDLEGPLQPKLLRAIQRSEVRRVGGDKPINVDARRRHGDVELLASAFWEELGGQGELPYALLRRWEAYEWPGNVRELRNEVARQAALGELAELHRRGREEPASSRDPLTATLAKDLPFARAKEHLAEFERRYVERTVAQHGGNVSHAAAAPGLALRYFQLLRARHSK